MGESGFRRNYIRIQIKETAKISRLAYDTANTNTSKLKEIKANENINTYETFSGDAITIVRVAVAIT